MLTKKLIQFKKYLTLEEAAKRLSITSQEIVSTEDILHLALEGHLTISFDFVNEVIARRVKFIGYEDAQWLEYPAKVALDQLFLHVKNGTPPFHIDVSSPSKFVMNGSDEEVQLEYKTEINNDDLIMLQPHETVMAISGVYDLLLIGYDRNHVKSKMIQTDADLAIMTRYLKGIFLQDEEGNVFQLQEHITEDETIPGSGAHKRKLEKQIAQNNPSEQEQTELWEKFKNLRQQFNGYCFSVGYDRNFAEATRFPDDGFLVVRTESLLRLEQSITGESNDEKKLSTTEKTTLLTIIAALCDYSAIDYTERGVATQIARMTDEIQASVSDDVIRKKLQEIPDALERRSK